MIIKFLKCTNGTTAIEYSILGAMAGIIIIGAITIFGEEVSDIHNNVADQASTAINNGID